jgi:hypothetical protein
MAVAKFEGRDAERKSHEQQSWANKMVLRTASLMGSMRDMINEEHMNLNIAFNREESKAKTQVATLSQERVTITGLTNSAVYLFRVVLESDIGDGAPSPWIEGTIGEPPPPCLPRHGGATGQELVVEWDACGGESYTPMWIGGTPSYQIWATADDRYPPQYVSTTDERSATIDCAAVPYDGSLMDDPTDLDPTDGIDQIPVTADRRVCPLDDSQAPDCPASVPGGVLFVQVRMETLTGISTGAIVRLACAQVPGAVPLTEAASTDTRIIILWKLADVEAALVGAPFVAYHITVYDGFGGPVVQRNVLRTQDSTGFPATNLQPRTLYYIELTIESSAGLGNSSAIETHACAPPSNFAPPFRNPSANGTDPDYFELGWVPPLDTGGCALTGSQNYNIGSKIYGK